MIGEVFAVMAALSWAIASIFDRKALEKISPLLANTLRSIPAFLFTFALMIIFEGFDSLLLITATDIFFIFIATTLALMIGDLLFLYSLQKLGVSRALPIASTYPLFAILFAYIFLSEEIGYFIIIGTIVIIAGIYLLSKENEKEEKKGRETNNYSTKWRKIPIVIIPIFVAIVWGLSQTIFRFVLFSTAPLTLTTIRLFYFSMAMIIVNVVIGNRKFYKKYNTYAGKMATIGGFLALGIGGLFLIISLSVLGVSVTAPLSSITPLFATILAVVILKEKVDLKLITGIGLIITGILLITVL
ncbi:MAG: GRP family sugar transporter [Candidatus Odinarchaeia archaeon]